jgi:steroid 5-alpha reductase family enzyme
VGDLLLVSAGAMTIGVLGMLVTALVAIRVGRISVVDVTWGLALTAVALWCWVVDATGLTLLVLGLVALWGVRLSAYMVVRSRGHGEDPRYERLVGAVGSPGWWGRATRKVFVLQGGAVWFVSWPLQAAAVGEIRWPWAVGIGVAVFGVGLFFEWVGDAQLQRFKTLPRETRPLVLDTGLWAWSRHPNYFGDAAVWWGIWLVAAVSTGWLPALLSAPAPLAMTYFLAYATGARPLERTMMQRPGYPEYAARVPMLVPRPPRRSG